MSDLSRLRARLARIEKRGKAIRAEIEQERADLDLFGDRLNRAVERRIERLDRELAASRKDWQETFRLVAAEERRLIENPAGFLRYT